MALLTVAMLPYLYCQWQCNKLCKYSLILYYYVKLIWDLKIKLNYKIMLGIITTHFTITCFKVIQLFKNDCLMYQPNSWLDIWNHSWVDHVTCLLAESRSPFMYCAFSCCRTSHRCGSIRSVFLLLININN